MKINWIVRIRNKNFWLFLIPAILVLIEQVLRVFGVKFDFGELGNNLNAVVDSVFVLLSVLGIVVDPTTAGVDDSKQAMAYQYPKEY